MLRPLREALTGWKPHAGRASDPIGAVAALWPEVVGEAVAQHCRPVEIVRGTLVVLTSSSAWSQQLTFLGDHILRKLHVLEATASIRALRFRVGSPRRGPLRKSGSAAVRPAQSQGADGDGVAQLRRRVRALHRARPVCPQCQAPRPTATLCAPCAGRERETAMHATWRLMYEAPWLGYAATAEIVAGLSEDDYETWRRALLARWWEAMRRLMWSKRPALPLERRIASSYVLLQSRLEPDRMSRAVMRNVLGDTLEQILFGTSTEKATVRVARATRRRSRTPS
jgi:hypothetical protein